MSRMCCDYLWSIDNDSTIFFFRGYFVQFFFSFSFLIVIFVFPFHLTVKQFFSPKMSCDVWICMELGGPVDVDFVSINFLKVKCAFWNCSTVFLQTCWKALLHKPTMAQRVSHQQSGISNRSCSDWWLQHSHTSLYLRWHKEMYF